MQVVVIFVWLPKNLEFVSSLNDYLCAESDPTHKLSTSKEPHFEQRLNDHKNSQNKEQGIIQLNKYDSKAVI